MIDIKKTAIVFILFVFYVFAYNVDMFGMRGVKDTLADRDNKNEPIPILNPDSLAKPIYDYPGIKRDVFSPVKKARVKHKPKPRAKPKPKPVIPKAPKPVEVFTKTLSFMGFMEQETERTVYLAGGVDSEIFIVKRGDIMDGHFEVVDLTELLITIKDMETGDMDTVELFHD